MGFFDFIASLEETKEQHINRDLRTRYYKCGYNQVKKVVLDYAESLKLKVISVDDAHGEVFIQSSSYHMIASIIQINPLETAIDIKVQSYKAVGFNKPKNAILSLYNELNNKNAEFEDI